MSFRRYEDDYGGGGRWDRDRFERARARSRPRESFRYEEDDRYGPRGFSRDIEIDERFDRRGPRPRYEERDRFFEDDRYGGRGKLDFMEEDRYRTSGKELAPYRNRWEQELPARPGMIRRRSSWDAFDRRPYPEPRCDDRYRERERDNHENVKLNIRMGSPDDHKGRPKSTIGERLDDRKSQYDDRRSVYDDRKSRRGGNEEHIDIDEKIGDHRINIDIDERRNDDYRRRDEPRYYREPPEYYRDPRDYEDYNGVRIIRERERIIDHRGHSRSRSRSRSHSPAARSEHSHHPEVTSYNYEETEKVSRPPGTKRGRTKMPKRLVHKSALVQIGHPFEEEENFYSVLYALNQSQIDEVVQISKTYQETEKTTYSYEREVPRAIEPPPPEPEPAQEEFEETVVRKVIENPTEDDYEKFRADGEYEVINRGSDHGSDHGTSHSTHRSEAKSRHRSKSRRRSKYRSKSRRRSDRYVEYSSDDDSHAGKEKMELILPEGRRDDRDIKDEIRRLERERRELRREREREDRRSRHSTRHRDRSPETSSSEETVRIEKDRRGRLIRASETSGRDVDPPTGALRRHRSKSRRRSKSRGVTQRQLDVAAATLT